MMLGDGSIGHCSVDYITQHGARRRQEQNGAIQNSGFGPT